MKVFILQAILLVGCATSITEQDHVKSETIMFCPKEIGFSKDGKGFSSIEESRIYIKKILEERKRYAKSIGYDEVALLKPILEEIDSDVCVNFFGSPATDTLVYEYHSKGINIRQCDSEPKRFVNVYNIKQGEKPDTFLLYVNWPLSGYTYLLTCDDTACRKVEESTCWIR